VPHLQPMPCLPTDYDATQMPTSSHEKKRKLQDLFHRVSHLIRIQSNAFSKPKLRSAYTVYTHTHTRTANTVAYGDGTAGLLMHVIVVVTIDRTTGQRHHSGHPSATMRIEKTSEDTGLRALIEDRCTGSIAGASFSI
jgi:hypothetical protein